jgi:membrane fusion protein (multidrug efflux system)
MSAVLVAAVLAAAPAAAWAEERGPFIGDVQPYRFSKVNAKIVGNVASISVKEGQAVGEGQVLAQLDDVLQRAQYEVARAEAQKDPAVDAAKVQLDKAERDLARVVRLAGTAAGVDRENATYNRDVAAANLRLRRMELDQARVNVATHMAALEQYRIRSPFKGVISRKVIEVGETTYPVDRVLFEVIDCSKVYVKVPLEITVASTLAVGAPAAVAADCLPDETFSGEVGFISPTVEPGGAYVVVKVLVDNPERRLLPGMAAKVTFGAAPAGPPAETAAGEAAPEAVVSK